MNKKGQNTLEVIIIAIILLGLLLTITLVMVQRNSDTERITSIQRDTLKCHHISSIITNFTANAAYSQGKLMGLEENVFISKGSIVIGEISCRYSGNASEQINEESYKNDYDTGFTLQREREYAGSDPVGVIYKIKKEGDKVVFCDQTDPDNDWC